MRYMPCYMPCYLARRFVARVVKSVKADKPAKEILFPDGATVTFYEKKHSRAKKSIAHVHLANPNVRFEQVTGDGIDLPSPVF